MIGRFLIESSSVCCCHWPERDNDLNMDLFLNFRLFSFVFFLCTILAYQVYQDECVDVLYLLVRQLPNRTKGSYLQEST